jgi:hypothetical protein
VFSAWSEWAGLGGSYREFASDGELMWKGEYPEGEPWEGICQIIDLNCAPSLIIAEFHHGKKIREIET